MTIASYITFKLGAELFAIDVARVREVLDLTTVTQVPAAPPYLRGVVNVRGSAVPVVDLRLRFGLPAAVDGIHTRIVVFELEIEGEIVPLGGVADSVHEVIEIDPSTIAAAPRIATRWRAEMIEGIATHEEQFVLVLDIARIFGSDDALLAAAAA